MTLERFLHLLTKDTGRLGIQVMGKTNLTIAQRYVELIQCPSWELKVRQRLYYLLPENGTVVSVAAWDSLASAESANEMVFIPDEDQPYEHIAGGKKYQSLQHAKAVALRDFVEWFPNCDPKYGVLVRNYDDEEGGGYLTAMRCTEQGEMLTTHMFFKNFRPIKRVCDGAGSAKVEMHLV